MTASWTAHSPGLLDTLAEQPLDPMLALLHMLRNDPRPGKLDLGIGVYRDEDGRTPVMRVVKQAEQILVDSQASKDYLSPEGDPDFVGAMAPLVLGPRAGDARLWGMQTPGGTGALRLAAALVARTNPEARVWLGTPTWTNHKMLMQAAGLAVAEHPFFDQARQTVQFDDMMAALKQARPGDAIVLHAGCHNPTGAALTRDQWHIVSHFLDDRGVVPIVDMAYQGLGTGLEDDAWALRHILDHVPEALVAVSCSKNFGLYRDRTGCLWVQGMSPGSVRRARANLNLIARVLWSMPPDHGASVVRTILQSSELAAQWRDELDVIRRRIGAMRRGLAVAVPQFCAAAGQEGMFSLLPLTRDDVIGLRTRHGIYMLESGRINMAGLSPATLPAFAAAVQSCLNRQKKTRHE